ncbi:gastric triacylglycerol lipase-like [Brevipalpus obovatus]|uniref:gastric triacylglycerol lipase-like n=1 Tax=Brevipalpus obovatus TaxID=246614 RepID=UPI003D9EB7A4
MKFSLPRSILLLLFSLILIGICASKSRDPDFGLTPLKYIEKYGYIGELHHIITPDGYILGVHRVRHPDLKDQSLHPVLLQHGWICSSMVFLMGDPFGGTIERHIKNYDTGETIIVQEPSSNLGFALADHGYDVWLLNHRGNTYSTNHTTYNPFKDSDFWRFSFEELALIDLPSSIDYIQRTTGKRNVGYVGHSQGTTDVLWLLAERPWYSEVINPVVLMAPIIDVKHIKSPVKYLAEDIIARGLRLKDGPLFTRGYIIDEFASTICNDHGKTDLCSLVLDTAGDLDTTQLNSTRIGVYLSYIPSGTSRKVARHYIQAITQKELRYFDEGLVGNFIKYGRFRAPKVNWGAINSTTLALFSSKDDAYSSKEEVQIFRNAIKVKLIDDYRVPYAYWSHLDFIVGMEAGRLINARIIMIMDNYFGHQTSVNDSTVAEEEHLRDSKPLAEDPVISTSSSDETIHHSKKIAVKVSEKLSDDNLGFGKIITSRGPMKRPGLRIKINQNDFE